MERSNDEERPLTGAQGSPILNVSHEWEARSMCHRALVATRMLTTHRIRRNDKPYII